MSDVLPPPLPDDVQRQIQDMKAVEKTWLNIDRTGESYIQMLYGIKSVLDYVRTHQSQLGTNTILDVGAGNTHGISQIARSSLGEHLNFEATVLEPHKEIAGYLGFAKTHIAPVETLEPIPTSSVAAIISVNGMAYSRSPEQAIASVDRVLVSGGILKATFRGSEKYQAPGLQTHDSFSSELMKRRYDIAIQRNTEKGDVDILLAVKQGKPQSARTHLGEDKKTWIQQAERTIRETGLSDRKDFLKAE